LIKDVLNITQIHLDRLIKATEEINQLNLENLDFEDFEIIKTIDTFIYRFMKLQDYMGNKLFKAFLNEIGEYQDNMSFIDVLDKLEKLEIIENAKIWIKLRKLRNKMAHEYPTEFEEIIEDIKEALKYIPYFQKTFENIFNYLKQRNLI